MWMMGIANSYTLEASFAGSSLGGRSDTHFSTMDYEQMGKSFCQTLLDFYDDDPKKVFACFFVMFVLSDKIVGEVENENCRALDQGGVKR